MRYSYRRRIRKKPRHFRFGKAEKTFCISLTAAVVLSLVALTYVRAGAPGLKHIRKDEIQYLPPGLRPGEKSALPSTGPEKLARALKLADEGRYRDALSLLQPFTAEPVNYPDEVSDYIAILVWDGQRDEAIDLYESLPEQFPRRAYLLRNVGKAYFDRGNFLKAAEMYEAALEKLPSDRESEKGVVLSYLEAGDLDRALAELERFLSRSPGSRDLALLKIRALSLKGQDREALQVFHHLAKQEGADRESLSMSLDDFITSLPDDRKEALLSDLRDAALKGDSVATADYILFLIQERDYRSALEVFEQSAPGIDEYPSHYLNWIGWAYFKTGNTEKAKLFYDTVLKRDPGDLRARTGYAYCLAGEGSLSSAMGILDRLSSEHPRNSEIMFARAYAFERAGDLWSAVREYEQILRVNRGNRIARRHLLLGLSDLGASSYALEEARFNFPGESELLSFLSGDMAADRIRWKEYEQALAMLRQHMVDESNLRAKYDYIVALTAAKHMEEAVSLYESLRNQGGNPPAWVRENVAGAYLYLEQPERALELYNEALENDPKSFNGRLGKFYVLQDLRKWEEARTVLDDLDRDVPLFLRRGEKPRPNWPKADVALARGWFFAYEERLHEAEKYFGELNSRAPANTNFRTGLAHARLWRGWPRKALQDFQISILHDPEDLSARLGSISAMSALAEKEQARKDLRELQAVYPRDKHVSDLARRFALEEMREMSADFAVSTDDDGVDGVRAEARITQPVTLYTNLSAYLMWQRTADKDDRKSIFRRGGIGLNHIFSSSLRVGQQFSLNHHDGDDFGSFTYLEFTPDDYWTLGLSYDTFTTDVPLRARVFDIESDSLNAYIRYRESDVRSYSISYTRQEFSDGNARDQGTLRFEQGLNVKNDWKMKLFLDAFISANTDDDVPYFNPERGISLSATHMTEHTVWRRYREAFVHRLYLTAGGYRQSGFSESAIGSLRYEHDFEFSDVHRLLYGAGVGRNSYDGEAVTDYKFYLNWRRLF